MLKKLLLGLTIVAVAGAGVAIAQQSGIKRTPLQKLDFPAGYNTVTAIAEVPAGGAAGRHTHPGAETGYVLEGELELVIDGKPPMKIKAGESYRQSRRQALQGARGLCREGRRAAGEAGAVSESRWRQIAGFVLDGHTDGLVVPARTVLQLPVAGTRAERCAVRFEKLLSRAVWSPISCTRRCACRLFR
jgi:hypothetical protein